MNPSHCGGSSEIRLCVLEEEEEDECNVSDTAEEQQSMLPTQFRSTTINYQLGERVLSMHNVASNCYWLGNNQNVFSMFNQRGAT